jgi:hypothetical protein
MPRGPLQHFPAAQSLHPRRANAIRARHAAAPVGKQLNLRMFAANARVANDVSR